MDINVTAGAVTGLTWLWEKYGERVTNICTDSMKEKWTQLHWGDSERKYRARVLDQVSTTLLLGYPKPIKIDNVYTDVHVLDQITAKRRFNFEDLAQKPFDFDGANIRPKRVSAETLLDQSKKIFILGKPGAGKTTFLKYIALLACKGKIAKTPVYVPLKEWSDSGLSILAFIEKQFTVCGFPDAKLFLQSIFNAGEALILLDGLDEVNQEDLARVKMIQELVDLANQYPDCIFCITCRIAATDYTFTQFTYVEIADFNGEQKDSFIQKWYQNEPEKLKLFISEWGKPDNQGFRELAQTPLLLALLCLAFDETLQFAKRRVDLYTEALDALLKKWDSTRGVLRAEVYRRISLPRKKQLLSRIAATNFQKGSYLFPKSVLVAEIEKFLLQLPPDDKTSRPEAEGVLSAIEYQHGLLVERAHGVYSFSHLTFQEYFTALYVVENQAGGTLDRFPVGRVKFLHLWPGQTPPGRTSGL
jgi:predicted NACHT family NTPase